MIYRIYDPFTITYAYWDDEGVPYETPSEDVDIEERPYTEDEALALLRNDRTRRLEECDYTQLPDVGIDAPTVALWRVYRQELRDITNGLQWNVTTWPAKP